MTRLHATAPHEIPDRPPIQVVPGLLHKYLAHLTWDRVSKDAPAWGYPNIATDILDVADAWSEHLASADQPTWNLPSLVLSTRQTLTGTA